MLQLVLIEVICNHFLKLFCNQLVKENALKKAEEWVTFLNEFDSGVKILVCQQCSVEGNSMHTPKINGIHNSLSC